MLADNKQRGAASLIVVIFTILILSLIVISFVHIMLSDQQQATANDLSQSAYDSAQVGVEDAKRAILRYQDICAMGGDCSAAYNELTSNKCNYAIFGLNGNIADYDPSNPEIAVQTGGADNLNQAYTCVKIKLNLPDYIGDLAKDESRLIPLTSDSLFDTIKIEWFNLADAQGNVQPPLPSSVGVPLTPPSLLALSDWTGNVLSTPPKNYPAIMRTQLIQYNKTSGFTLSDLDNNTNGRGFNSTIFLYPASSTSAALSTEFPSARATPTFSPYQVRCDDDNLRDNGYACSVTIKLPAPSAEARGAYLILESLYKESHYRVSMSNGGSSVNFHAVQPEVDSTGRADKFYRRVSTRIGLGDITFPYPKAEVDLTYNFCKNFLVTNNPYDYDNVGSCQF